VEIAAVEAAATEIAADEAAETVVVLAVAEIAAALAAAVVVDIEIETATVRATKIEVLATQLLRSPRSSQAIERMQLHPKCRTPSHDVIAVTTKPSTPDSDHDADS